MNFVRNSLLFLCLIGPHMADSQTQTPTKQILDLKVDSFKTGLEEVGNSFWVDDNQFLMTTLQEGAQQAFRSEDTPSRIALVNFATKTIKYIAQDAQLLEIYGASRVDLNTALQQQQDQATTTTSRAAATARSLAK